MDPDRDMRGAETRVDRGEAGGKQPVAGEGEQRTRGAEDVAAEPAQHREAGTRQQQRAPARADGADRIGERRGRLGERPAEQPFGHDLDGDVEQADPAHRQQQRARDGARGAIDLSRGGERGFHSRQREHGEDHRAAEALAWRDRRHYRSLRPGGEGIGADDHEQEQRDQLGKRRPADDAGGEADALHVDPGDRPQHDDDQQPAEQRRGEGGEGGARGIRQRGGDPAAGEDAGDPQQHARDEAGVVAVGGLDRAIGAAAGGHAAARLRKAADDCAHRDQAGDIGERGGGARRGGHGGGQAEDARADHLVDDRRGEAGDSDGADEPRIAVALLCADLTLMHAISPLPPHGSLPAASRRRNTKG